MKLWTVVLCAAMALSACGSDDNVGGATGYTQLGDVSLDGALGDGATGDDTATASDALSDTSSDSSSGTDGTASGTDALADSGPAKYPACISLIGCVAQSCPATNWSTGCDAACLPGASPAVASAYASVSSCIENTCRDGLCKGSSDPKCIGECIGKKCMNKIAVCGADGKTGQAQCGSYFTCTAACGSDKDPLGCVSGCYAALSTSAQSQYAALDACVSAAGGADAFASCPEQALTCLAAGASGSKTCLEALSCSGACDTGTDAQKAACMTACWSQTSAKGQTAFAAALKCNASSKTGCVDAMLTCTEPNGIGTCTASLTCMQGCQQSDPQAKSTCFYGCLHSASPAEAKKNLELQVCMGGCNCKGDQKCTDTCLTTTCKAQLTACQAP